MKTLRTLAATVMLGLTMQAACAAEIKPLNSIIMEVNSSIITYGDLQRTMRELQSRASNISEAQVVQAAKTHLLERSLLADVARAQQLKVTEQAIDEELQRRARAENTTVAALYARAGTWGYTRSAYRLEVAKDVLINFMLSDLNSDIDVNEAQINQAIAQAQQSGRMLPAPEPYTVYTIRRILLNAGSQNNMDAVQKRMQQIATAIEQGSDFEALARRYSQEAQAANGGLHEVSDLMLPENVENILHQLKPGQVGAMQRSGTTWQMIELLGSRTETDPVKMQREAVRRQLVRQAQQRNQEQFIGQLQQNAVVREY